MERFGNADYALSRVENSHEVVKSHLKYAQVCKLRDVTFIESFDKNSELDDVIYSLFGRCLKTQRVDSISIINLQNMTKGSGFACSSLKKACWEKSPYKLLEFIKHILLTTDLPVIWLASGKLEIRLIEKDCRVYLICPMWFSAQIQTFMKRQDHNIMEARFTIPSAVGMQVPVEWIRLHTRLHRHVKPDFEPKYYMSDIKLFDSMQYRSLFWRDARLRARGLSLEGQQLDEFMHCMYWTINRIVILPDGQVVFTKDGNPSGKPGTTVDNGINQIQMVAMCWHSLYHTFHGFLDFIERSGFFTNGDDVIAIIVCEEDERFLRRLPEEWKLRFGSELKAEFATEWKDVHFLGSQPLSNDYPGKYLVKPYDLPRLVANMIHKGQDPTKFDPVKELQRGLAYRLHLATTATLKEHEALDQLNLCVNKLIEEFDATYHGVPEWDDAVRQHLQTDSMFLYTLVSTARSLGEPFLDTREQQIRPTSRSQTYVRKARRSPLILLWLMLLVVSLNVQPIKDNIAMLSKKAFLKSKAAKYAGLDSAQKEQRYNAYVASYSANSQPHPTIRVVEKFGKSQKAKTKAAKKVSVNGNSNRQLNTSNPDVAYAMSLCHPDDEKYNHAKIPSPVPQDSDVINTDEVLIAGCPSQISASIGAVPMDFNGAGGIIMRPNTLGRQHVYTSGSQMLGLDPTGGQASPGLAVYSPAGLGDTNFVIPAMGNFGVPMPNQSCGVPGWQSPIAMQEIQTLCAKYRVVSAKLCAIYIGPPITGSGLIAGGTIPFDQFQSLTCSDSTSTSQVYTGISFSQFLKLRGVINGPAMKGMEVLYIPRDERATEWKETILDYTDFTNANNGPPGLKTSHTQFASTKVRQSMKKGELKGQLKQFKKLRKLIKENGPVVVSGTSRLGPDGRYQTTSVQVKSATAPTPGPDALGATINTAIGVSRAFFGQGGEIVPQPEDGPAQEAQTMIAGTLLGVAVNGTDSNNPLWAEIDILLSNYSDNVWDESADAMAILWDGVAPSDQAAQIPNWAGNLFRIEKYVNYEVVVDANTVSIGSIVGSGSPAGASPTGIAMAQAAALKATQTPVPPTSTLTKIKNWMSNAWDKAQPWIKAGQEAWQVASAVGTAIGSFL
jgi:hypothetical protein